MKQFWKDVGTAFTMGMVLPSVLLAAVVLPLPHAMVVSAVAGSTTAENSEISIMIASKADVIFFIFVAS